MKKKRNDSHIWTISNERNIKKSQNSRSLSHISLNLFSLSFIKITIYTKKIYVRDICYLFTCLCAGAYSGFFSGGGERYKIYMYTVVAGSANFFGGFAPPELVSPPPPHKHNTKKTHIQKWSDQWSEPLRKNTIYLYDSKENYRTSWNVRKINSNKNCLLYSVLVNIDQQKCYE